MSRRLLVSACLGLSALALVHAAGSAFAGPILSDGSDSFLRFPEIPKVPSPPAGRAFDPSGPNLRGSTGNPGVTSPLVPPRPPATKESGGKPASPQNQADILNDLFHRLSSASDSEEASGIALAIEHIWLRSGSDTADLLMSRTVTAIGKGDLDLAIGLLDKIVVLEPNWAEGWNKRATLRFLRDDDPGSMEDISHVLRLEPRHFGALSGMGFILQRNGMKKDALTLMRKAAAVYPHNPELQKVIDELTPEVEGRDI
jgi:hypothetical protein